MGNVGIYFNYQQLLDVATKLECKYDEIGKVLKASLLEEKRSKFYRELRATPDVNKIIEEYLRNEEIGIIAQRRAELLNEVVFTPA